MVIEMDRGNYHINLSIMGYVVFFNISFYFCPCLCMYNVFTGNNNDNSFMGNNFTFATVTHLSNGLLIQDLLFCIFIKGETKLPEICSKSTRKMIPREIIN